MKTIHRNGIRFLNTDYYNDALYGLRDRVIIRYSLFDLSYVKVYTAKGEYLCTAKRVEATHPMAYHMGSVTYMQSFKQKIKKQKQLRNRTLRTIKKYIPKEDVKFIETQMIEENNPIDKAEIPIPEKEPVVAEEKSLSVFMNGYEKYEYLMREGCTTPEERKWLAEYMKSDEYKQIYEEQ